jgi:hypothetical protein
VRGVAASGGINPCEARTNGPPFVGNWMARGSAPVRRAARLSPAARIQVLGRRWTEKGVLRRRHVLAEKIEDIGKESDGWEEDEARTEGPSSSFDRQLMIERIKSVGKRELMREASIGMRTIDAVWDGAEVADVDLKRMNAAAERVESRRRKREEEEVKSAVAWLRAKRDEMGLVALAKVLGVDTANLAKVMSGSRLPPKPILDNFRMPGGEILRNV